MDIETGKDTNKIYFNDESSLNAFLEKLKNQLTVNSHHLSLFLGLYEPNKKKALEEIRQKTGKAVKVVDANDVVSRNESETYRGLDQLFDNMDGQDVIIYFENGDRLCGVYTGYTHSRVKYATPQERYFLKKVQNFQGIVIVDVDEFTDADTTLRRAAQSIVVFTLPDSFLKRLSWRLKNFSLHGYDLKTDRPEAYHDTGD